MKKILVSVVVLLLAIGIVGAVRAADSSNIEVTGLVMSVGHQTDTNAELRFKVSLGDDLGPAPYARVFVTGALADEWDAQIHTGITVTVRGKARVSNDPAVAIYIDAAGIE